MDIGPWEVFGLLIAVIVVLVAWRFMSGASAMRSAPARTQPAPTQRVVVAEPPVNCPACATPNASANRFCSECGATLVPPAPESITCPSCATLNPPGQAFCGECGTRLTPAAA
jgi:membrane protease subunit (stomatin/prohibitin family)